MNPSRRTRTRAVSRVWPRALLAATVTLTVGALVAGCGSGGTSVQSSPAQVVRDLFAAIQAKNCDRAYALQSTALDREEGGKTKACAGFLQLEARYRDNTFRIDKVTRHGDRASVDATRTNPDGTTRTATLGTVIEDGRWKVDSIARTSPTTVSTARSGPRSRVEEGNMSEHPNVALVRRGYDAFAAADVATLSEALAAGIVWHVPGNNQLSGDYKGRDATLAYLGRLAELTDGTFKVELDDLVGGDDHVAGLNHDTATRHDHTLDVNECLVFQVRDAKITDAWEYYNDQPTVDHFWR